MWTLNARRKAAHSDVIIFNLYVCKTLNRTWVQQKKKKKKKESKLRVQVSIIFIAAITCTSPTKWPTYSWLKLHQKRLTTPFYLDVLILFPPFEGLILRQTSCKGCPSGDWGRVQYLEYCIWCNYNYWLKSIVAKCNFQT